jgi:hypothetical protein
MPSRTSDAAKRVYDLYRRTPEIGSSSYLHDHYRRGLLRISPPPRSQETAHAAWRAGRDTADNGDPT